MSNSSSTSTGWNEDGVIINAHTLRPNTKYTLVLEYGYAPSDQRSRAVYDLETCGQPTRGNCSIIGYEKFSTKI